VTNTTTNTTLPAGLHGALGACALNYANWLQFEGQPPIPIPPSSYAKLPYKVRSSITYELELPSNNGSLFFNTNLLALKVGLPQCELFQTSGIDIATLPTTPAGWKG